MDKYDLAIQNLTANPHEIFNAWNIPWQHEAGCLFKYADSYSGCLTQIRSDLAIHRGTLTQAAEIAADERIPEDANEITVEILPVFAEWQRRLDRELGENRNG